MATAGDRTRIGWLDRARGIGIILVVFGHAIVSVDRSGLPADHALLGQIEGAIYSFHMPLFFVLAGIGHTLASAPARSLKPLSAILLGLVYPYLLWSLIWIGLKAAFPGSSNSVITEPAISILWAPVDQFWFLYTLVLIRLAWWAIDASGSRLLRQAAIVGPLAVCLVGFSSAGGTISLWLLLWAACYGIGVSFGSAASHLSTAGRVGLAAAGAAVWLAILVFDPPQDIGAVTTLLTVIAFAGSAMVIGLAALGPSAESLTGRVLSLLGEASLAIFLTHSIIGAGARVLLAKADLLSATSLTIAATVLGLVLPTLAHVVLVGLDRRTGWPLLRLAGLGTQRRLYSPPLFPIPQTRAGTSPATD